MNCANNSIFAPRMNATQVCNKKSKRVSVSIPSCMSLSGLSERRCAPIHILHGHIRAVHTELVNSGSLYTLLNGIQTLFHVSMLLVPGLTVNCGLRKLMFHAVPV